MKNEQDGTRLAQKTGHDFFRSRRFGWSGKAMIELTGGETLFAGEGRAGRRSGFSPFPRIRGGRLTSTSSKRRGLTRSSHAGWIIGPRSPY